MKNISEDKFINNLKIISVVIFLIGSIFKIQHYPYGHLIFLIGIFFYMLLLVIELKTLKESSGHTNSIIISPFVMMLCSIYSMMHYPYGKIVFYIGIGLFVIGTHLEIRRMKIIIKKNNEVQSS